MERKSMTKYNPAKKPEPIGGDYRPHYRKSEVDAHLQYLDKFIEAQAIRIVSLKSEKVSLETQLANTLRLWKEQVNAKY